MTDEIVRVPEIAAMTGKPVDTIRWYRHRQTAGYDDGPRMFKLGRNVVAKRADVVAWIESQYGDAAALSASLGAAAARPRQFAQVQPDHLTSSDVFTVKWSAEDGEWVATCSRMPSLSWFARSPSTAITGLIVSMFDE